jgi:hypothetical protein
MFEQWGPVWVWNTISNIKGGFVWVWNTISNIKGETKVECVWEQGAEKDICIEEGWSDRRVERAE